MPKNNISLPEEQSEAKYRKLLTHMVNLLLRNKFVDNNKEYIYTGVKSFLEEDLEYFSSSPQIDPQLLERQLAYVAHLHSHLYFSLADIQSRLALLVLSSFNVLGHRYVRLPLWNPYIKEELSSIHKLCRVGTKTGKFRYFDLSGIGLNLKIIAPLRYVHMGIFGSQYAYMTPTVQIKVDPDDVVLDCGAENGFTSLLFGLQAGRKGRVLAIDCNPASNIIYNKNMKLNPTLAKRISKIQCALSNVDGDEVYFDNSGGATSILSQAQSGELSATTKQIDSLAIEHNLSTVDFIKMDIEGSESLALQGAINTLTKFKPKLAISIYHKDKHEKNSDYKHIIKYIQSLQLGYQFYFNHHALIETESVLYAVNT